MSRVFILLLSLLACFLAVSGHGHHHHGEEDHGSHAEHSHGHTHGTHELFHPPSKERTDGITPLMSSILKNQINAATALLADEDIDVNAQNNKGITALMFAVGKGMTDIVRLLIDRGADLSLQNVDGLTALQIAVGIEKLDMVEMLIEAGADIVGLMNKYPKAKSVYKNLVSRDLLQELSSQCGISGDLSQSAGLIDYFLKHGLTKFFQVAYLDDSEIAKIPAGSEQEKAQLTDCFARAKAAALLEAKHNKQENNDNTSPLDKGEF